MGAAFLALLWPRLHDRRNLGVGLVAAALALLLVPVTAAGVRSSPPAGSPWSRACCSGTRPARTGLMVWLAIVLGGLGCWVLKLAGLSVPPKVLERPLVERVADLIPVALLSALVAVQVFSAGTRLVVDARALGLAVAVVLLVLRAPFLVVVFGAALSAALVRLVW